MIDPATHRRCSHVNTKRYFLSCIALASACGSSDVSLGTKQPLLTLIGTTQGMASPAAPDAGAGGSAGSSLAPVLVFNPASAGADLLVVEPDVEGSVPGDFTLRVFEPPPAEVLSVPPPELPGEPRVALAYLAAAYPDHPSAIEVGRPSEPSQSGIACEGCPGTCTRHEWCSIALDPRCFEEDVCCTDECCRVVRSAGDESLRNPWALLEGVVERHVVLYLAEPARKDSRIAHGYGASEGISRGYHLVSTRLLTSSEEFEQSLCLERAFQVGAERYNAEYGTEYLPEELQSGECGGARCPQEILDEVHRLVDMACIELDCLAGGRNYVFEVLPDSDQERLSLRLGPDALPILHPRSRRDPNTCM